MIDFNYFNLTNLSRILCYFVNAASIIDVSLLNISRKILDYRSKLYKIFITSGRRFEFFTSEVTWDIFSRLFELRREAKRRQTRGISKTVLALRQ